tara:strand:- start:36 stop:596 length:561 start_codon:yes stop_codon:yes gene_type:complete
LIKLKNLLPEAITLDVKVGDTILTGRFKNKKVVVKSIGKDEHGMPTINGKKVVTFRTMKKTESVMLERADYHELAKHLRDKHKIKSRIVMAPLRGNKAEYNVDTDTMHLHPTGNLKDFIESVLHELHHAMEAKRLGKSKYKKAYEHEMNMAVSNDKDPYKDNDFEIRAEKWAKRWAPKWIKKLKLK